MRNLSPLFAIPLLALACGGTIPDSSNTEGGAIIIENPTGDCAAPDSGARAYYHDPGDTKWLPDCQNPLAREYWRVFAKTAESAYLIPRADGAPGLQPACADEDHPLHSIVKKYPLCEMASSRAEVDRVNSLPPADALAIAHELHRSLRFVVTDEGMGIAPFPMPSDIMDVCELHSNADNPELQELCEEETARLQSGYDIGFSYSGPGAVALVERLNELYQIPLD